MPAGSHAYNSLWQVRTDAWSALDPPEVHGYRADLGYRVYVDKALEIAATTRPARRPIRSAPPHPPRRTLPSGRRHVYRRQPGRAARARPA